MVIRYKDQIVAEIQRKSEAGVPYGPRYRGLPRGTVERDPNLVWMLEVEQDVQTAGSDDGEFVWVLADDWLAQMPADG